MGASTLGLPASVLTTEVGRAPAFDPRAAWATQSQGLSLSSLRSSGRGGGVVFGFLTENREEILKWFMRT